MKTITIKESRSKYADTWGTIHVAEDEWLHYLARQTIPASLMAKVKALHAKQQAKRALFDEMKKRNDAIEAKANAPRLKKAKPLHARFLKLVKRNQDNATRWGNHVRKVYDRLCSQLDDAGMRLERDALTIDAVEHRLISKNVPERLEYAKQQKSIDTENKKLTKKMKELGIIVFDNELRLDDGPEPFKDFADFDKDITACYWDINTQNGFTMNADDFDNFKLVQSEKPVERSWYSARCWTMYDFMYMLRKELDTRRDRSMLARERRIERDKMSVEQLKAEKKLQADKRTEEQLQQDALKLLEDA